jgi:DNA ligase (NAD+)
MGKKIVSQLVNKGLLNSYADIFYLDQDLLKRLDRMGDKSAWNLKNAIEQSKNITFDRLIYSMGIRHVGEHLASLLANQFHSLSRLMTATLEDLAAIEGIGPIVAESVFHFFQQEENRTTIHRILSSGVEILYDAPSEETLKGKVFVITGSLNMLTRSQAQKAIETAGGKVTGSVSRNTDFLVVGENPGSKLQRAKELGVEIIDEPTLNKLLYG